MKRNNVVPMRRSALARVYPQLGAGIADAIQGAVEVAQGAVSQAVQAAGGAVQDAQASMSAPAIVGENADGQPIYASTPDVPQIGSVVDGRAVVGYTQTPTSAEAGTSNFAPILEGDKGTASYNEKVWNEVPDELSDARKVDYLYKRGDLAVAGWAAQNGLINPDAFYGHGAIIASQQMQADRDFHDTLHEIAPFIIAAPFAYGAYSALTAPAAAAEVASASAFEAAPFGGFDAAALDSASFIESYTAPFGGFDAAALDSASFIENYTAPFGGFDAGAVQSLEFSEPVIEPFGGFDSGALETLNVSEPVIEPFGGFDNEAVRALDIPGEMPGFQFPELPAIPGIISTGSKEAGEIFGGGDDGFSMPDIPGLDDLLDKLPDYLQDELMKMLGAAPRSLPLAGPAPSRAGFGFGEALEGMSPLAKFGLALAAGAAIAIPLRATMRRKRHASR